MKKSNIFRIGYSDLLTSMFFIMLVLFVVSVGFLNEKMNENVNIILENGNIILENERLITELKEKSIKIEDERLNRLLKLEEQFAPLKRDHDFFYLEECKKFIVKDLMGVDIFESKKQK